MVLFVTLAIALPAFAHGEKKHVVGTIERVTSEFVDVKTAAGKTVTVKLAAATVYVTKDGKPAKFADVTVGQRVVIHATPKGPDLIADELKFAPAAASAKSRS
jgi:hypothetical protein